MISFDHMKITEGHIARHTPTGSFTQEEKVDFLWI